MDIAVKSFGYGIYLITASKVPDKERLSELTGIPVTELISDDGQHNFAMASTGHEPSKYEMSSISQEEWENMRTAVDAQGSKQFSERLSMLESLRVDSKDVN